ncbi:hypothetical protein HDU96_010017 [Phlyctochytrium bullatum]|nr:hypothetical protein HDU96_010017 [Phlyctochytrium bullatum]
MRSSRSLLASASVLLLALAQVAKAQVNRCAGQRNDTVICTSRTQFTICSDGAQTPVQNCPATTACCNSLCRFPSDDLCATSTGGVCSSVPNGDVCSGPAEVTSCAAGIAFQKITCPTGQVCLNNRCQDAPAVPSSTAPKAPLLPTTTAAVSAAPATSSAAAVIPSSTVASSAAPKAPIDPTTTAVAPPAVIVKPADCSTKNDGDAVCISPTAFDRCINKQPLNAAQPCANGTFCCGGYCAFLTDPQCLANPPIGLPSAPAGALPTTTAAASSVAPPAATTAPPAPVFGSCAGVADNGIICVSGTRFNFCQRGVLATDTQQYCAPGTVCCADTNTCDYPSNCKVFLPTLTAALPVYTQPPAARGATSCAGLPDTTQLCTSATTFNYCYQGALLKVPSQSCAPGTVCCSDTNTCDFVQNCKSQLPGPTTCSNKGDGETVCITDTYFNFCKSGSIIKDAPQQCAPGTVCCADSGRCDFAVNCKFQLPGVPVGQPIPNNPNPGNSGPTTPGTCTNRADNTPVCVSSTRFNYCVNGAFVNAPSQACPDGTVCCANTNRCDFSDNCGTVLPATCNGVTTGPVCIGPQQFNYCLNGAFVKAAPQSCPSGTVCCADTNRCDFPTRCGSVLPVSLLPPGQQQPPPTQAPTATTSRASILVPQPTATSPATGPVITPGSCNGIGNNDIAYSERTDAEAAATVNVCDKVEDNGAACVNPNSCVDPASPLCGGAGAAVETPETTPTENVEAVPIGKCEGVPDYGATCTDFYTFKYCNKGSIIPNQVEQVCGNSLSGKPFVCCPDGTSATCKEKQYCKSLRNVVVPPPPADGIPSNICKDLSEGDQACVDGLSFAVCGANGKPDGKLQKCGEGTVCCQKSGQCITERVCSGAKPPEIKPLNPCTLLPDGVDTCSQDLKSVYTCKNKG